MTDIYKVNTGYPWDEWGFVGTNQTQLCDGQNEAVAAIFIMPEDATITTVGFINAAKGGTPADDTWTVSIQGVTAGGVPDGTILGGASPASRTFPNATYTAASFGANTNHQIVLANSIALQGGTMYSLVIQKTGATDATNTLTFRYGVASGGIAVTIPYTATADTTPTWTRQAQTPVCWLIRSASKTYLYPAILSSAVQAFGTTTEVGFSFTLPTGFGASNTYGVRGVRFVNGTTGLAAGNTYRLTLYSNTGGANPTILQQTADIDSDMAASTAGTRGNEILFNDDVLSALAPGTKYGIGFSNSAASGWSLQTITLPAAGDRTAYPLGGLTFMTRTLASAYPPDAADGAFTETTTTLVNAELLLADFTAASGGGGASVHRIP